MTNVCVVFSFACAYFAYKIVLGIDLFPYINLMATFILIGISCDNVFVIFDAWYSEKLDIYNRARLLDRPLEFYSPLTPEQQRQYERDRHYTLSKVRERLNNNERLDQNQSTEQNDDQYFDRIKNTDLVRMMKVNDEQMIQMMGGVLRHAAASVFVTSFTTSAAFFTNMITRIAYVQLFGLFMVNFSFSFLIFDRCRIHLIVVHDKHFFFRFSYIEFELLLFDSFQIEFHFNETNQFSRINQIVFSSSLGSLYSFQFSNEYHDDCLICHCL